MTFKRHKACERRTENTNFLLELPVTRVTSNLHNYQQFAVNLQNYINKKRSRVLHTATNSSSNQLHAMADGHIDARLGTCPVAGKSGTSLYP